MSVQVENLEKNMAKLTIEVAAEEVEKAIQAAYLKEKGKISMPGFRKGKVPRKMIEKMYGEAVFYEDAANTLIQENYPAAVEESGIDIVSRPTIDVVQIESGKPFIFTAEVAVRPEVKLGKYLGVQVTKIDTSVSDEEVEAAVEKERNNNARTVTVTDRPIANGDTAVIDFEGFVDGVAFEGGKGENHPLEIGSHSFIEGFEDQLNAALKEKGAVLTVSEDTRDIDGGFVLTYGGIEENCSFEALFDSAHEVLQDKVQEILFS